MARGVSGFWLESLGRCHSLSSGTQGRPRLGQGRETSATVDILAVRYLWNIEVGMSKTLLDTKVLSLSSRGLAGDTNLDVFSM